jgi:hypothetical protein
MSKKTMPITVPRKKRVATAAKKSKKVMTGGGDCTAETTTFTPTTGDNTFMYGLPSSDIGGATMPLGNCSLNAAAQIASTVLPIPQNYAIVDFGQGVNDPVSPAMAPFSGGGKKKKRAAAGGKKKKTKTVAGKKKTGKKCPPVAKKTKKDEGSPWMLTDFKIKITNSEGKKVVKSLYYNTSTGEYRHRKMIKKGRKKIARFSPIPKSYDFVK